MKLDFEHRQSAHCENGVSANLLKYYGIDVNEPLVFGIGAGLFFSYLPFIKVNHAPGSAFRTMPGLVFKRAAKNLGIQIFRKKYRSAEKAMRDLDKSLEQGLPVGLQVGVFHLTYFPDPYRFHFNAHNLVVYGKEGDEYLISDPVMETTTRLTRAEMKRVRFAKGIFSPKGQMYHPVNVPDSFDLKTAVRKGIKRTAKDMTKIPIPFFGVKGIRFLAKDIRKWQKKHGDKKAALYLAAVVRMQEEIGTGGAGFRFLYAAFLQEAAKILQIDELNELSTQMTQVGDLWREFALAASRIYKDRSKDPKGYDSAADLLVEIAAREEKIFTRLLKLV
ncbi:BtrH N-terminal domain-containing protein [bacterium SCSIO 12741]|nr:BtrH N-terminal domain-containing protein [bacterium SCSIO 12741]